MHACPEVENVLAQVRDVYGWHYGWCVVLALVSVAVWVDRLRPKDAGSAHAEHVP